jgi:drug/metabolite transporter (DMT)-like permease
MQNLNRSKVRIQADILMFIAALVWGGGFVAQRVATYSLGYFAFNGIRFLMAALVLLPVGIRFLGKFDRRLWWVVLAGVFLFGGSALQQAGLATTSAGSAGFITGVYVVLVPFFLAVLFREKVPLVNWIAAAAALGGTYLLSTGGQNIRPSSGDILELIGAVIWAFHIIVVGKAVKHLNIFTFSVGQFLVCGVLNLILAQIFTPLSWTSIQPAIPALLYGGLGSVALGFTLQAVGQSKAPTADAVLIFSLEAVFAAIFGALLLSERMNWVQVVGCGIIFISILSAQFFSARAEGQQQELEPTAEE